MHAGKITFVLDRSRMKKVMDSAVNAGLNRAAIVAVKAIKGSFSKNGKYRPSAPGTPPNRNRSTLYNSIASTKAENGVCYVYTSGVAYARIQEFGGTITAKGRMLTIPLNDEASRMRERVRSLHFLPLYFRKTKAGKAILFDGRAKWNKTRTARPMFLLVSGVRMPARPYLRPAFSNSGVLSEMTKAFCLGSRNALLGTL